MKLPRKIAVAGSLLGVTLAVATTAHALTEAERQAQLQILYQALATLQAQLASLAGGQTGPGLVATPSSSGAPFCLRLSGTLRPGSRDAGGNGPVAALQQFLQSTHDYTYAEITGYFGSVTEEALKRYQARSGIISSGTPDTTGWGLLGPRTRQQIEADSCGSGSGTTFFPTTPSSPVNPGVIVNPALPQIGACFVNGTTILNGRSARLYSTTNPPLGDSCLKHSIVRRCTNGILSESNAYQYLSCTTATGRRCTVGAVTMAHDERRTFFNAAAAPSGQSCSARSQERTCTDGTLSGSSAYAFTACADPLGCTLDGHTIDDKETHTYYFVKNIPSGEQCSSYSLSRTCSNGTLSGDTSYKYASCSPVSSSSCAVDNQVLSNGSSQRLYSSTVAPVGATCNSISQVRSCNSGTLSGDSSFHRASCIDDRDCSLDGLAVEHGDSEVFYSAQKVALSSTCSSVAQTRTCTNAKLSGSDDYKFANCAVAPPSSCALDGTIVSNGGSATFYSARTTPSGTTCSSISKTRSCTNGTLGGDSAYKYAECEVAQPTNTSSGSGGGSGGNNFRRNDPPG